MASDLDEFLQNLFPNVSPGEAVVLVCADDGFQARRWVPGQEPVGDQVYYCISSVRDDNPRQGVLSRTAANLAATHVVVLDDVGTKIDPTRIRVMPTYCLRTSPGNTQWGYRLSVPADPALASALIEGIAKACLTDPGAKRADRIMRVPGSLNVKYDTPFIAELHEAHWERSWTLNELAAALGVEPADPTAVGRPPGLGVGESDPVFDWMLEHGRVLGGPNPRGWYAIECPWIDEHTGEVDHGTDYMPGNPGAFKCLHGHCAERHTSDLRKWIEEQDPAAEIGPIRSEAVEGLARALRGALGDGSSGVGSNLPPIDEALLSPAQRLQRAIQGVPLGPHLLPDPDTTANGNVSARQPVSDARVHTVMNLIGMTARLNVMTYETEAFLTNFDEDIELENLIGLLIHACHRCGMRDQESIRHALHQYAAGKQFHPVLEWIDSKDWDGKDRIQFLCETLVMQDKRLNPWRDIVVRRWLNQGYVAVTNWERPTPTDIGYTLVLQGDENIGKSKWFKHALLPHVWVTGDMTLKLDGNERDAVKRATMTPIVELAEIDTTFKRSESSALKNFLTTTTDIYRPAYGRSEIKRPRCTMYGASVNKADYLIDPSGERRFWTLAVRRIKWEHDIDLQQLWVQVACQENHQYWLTDDEIAMHHRVSATHWTDSDAVRIVRDLEFRRNDADIDHNTWVHKSAKELLNRYECRDWIVNSSELNSRLARTGWAKRAKIRGKMGWWVPPHEKELTTIELAARIGLVVKDGGKDGEN